VVASRKHLAPVALYRLLLFCYPARFRAEFAEQMSIFFRDQYQDAWQTGGWRHVVALCLEVIADLFTVALKERSMRLFADIRLAVRTLRKSPTFTIVAIATMGLGIGGTTTMVSVFKSVIVNPVPFRDPDRLAMVYLNAAERGAPRASFSMADYVDWQAHNRSFEESAAFGVWGRSVTIAGPGDPDQVSGIYTTASFFSILGVRPAIGRLFVPGDDEPGRARGVVISERLWRRYGGRAEIVGSLLTVNGEAHSIVGVAPSSFRYPQRDTDVWAILPLTPPTRRGPYFLRGVGRLKADVTVDQAEAQLGAVPLGVRVAAAPGHTALKFAVVPFQEQFVADVRPMLTLLLASVGVLLLIAVANVANLQITRTSARRREFATRLSVGADRWQIAQQLLIESIVLALAGGAVGVLLAFFGVGLLKWTSPANLPRVDELAVDGGVLFIAAGISLCAGVLFGLAPALRASAWDLTGALNEAGRHGTQGRERGRLRAALAIAQVALSCMLLVGAGLLVRSLAALVGVEPGIRTADVLTLQISPSGERYREDLMAREFYRELLDGVRSIPGIQNATLASTVPPGQGGFAENITLEHAGPIDAPILLPIVDPQYFDVLSVPLIAGRSFTDADTAQGPRVTIISQAMADRYYPNQDAVGQRLKIGGRERVNAPWVEIVGVVGDVRYRALDAQLEPVFYIPHVQNTVRSMYLVVRSALPPAFLRDVLRQQVAAIDGSIPVREPRRIDDLLYDSVAQPRFRTWLVATFAFVAVLIAGVGLYGVLAYGVLQREREMGIRLALGAQRRTVAGLILRDAAGIGAAGLITGIAGALALQTLVTRFLFGVSADDITTFGAAVVVLGGVCLLAGCIPARRASRVDPVIALKAG
jgi:putative ABC transport system permease protein